MQTIADRTAMTTWVDEAKYAQKTVAFVPTMGNLHDGHLSLVQIAKSCADLVVVSIFINPTQFGENEDFSTYPRTLSEDTHKLSKLGVDILFTPSEADIYPHDKNQTTQIIIPHLSHILCGAFRPQFFIGVASVIARLFQIIPADFAVFGKKDYQQLLVIRHMVADLHIPIKIIAGDINREANGLAMSSRNMYLSNDEKSIAAQIYQTLQWAEKKLKNQSNSEESITQITNDAKIKLNCAGFKVDYFEIRNTSLIGQDYPAIILVAAWLGNTRLIDNLEIIH